MSLEEKRNALIKKRQRFQSAIIIAPILALVSSGFIGMILNSSKIDVPAVGIAFVVFFVIFYIAGYYLPIHKWFNS